MWLSYSLKTMLPLTGEAISNALLFTWQLRWVILMCVLILYLLVVSYLYLPKFYVFKRNFLYFVNFYTININVYKKKIDLEKLWGLFVGRDGEDEVYVLAIF